ncbi:YesV protein [Geomicrobium sp. JCM 19037]|uniref:YesL family protein n=1 Tax=unclassified Geomicrobium TaxID=2628951 RepID=UPI00045F3A76|nr:DUF624 domain-containing protein [Geomicrobium sp. JCM 19037]GAK05924.1 YesV protein [Geomicrobium sp. JCM 19037]
MTGGRLFVFIYTLCQWICYFFYLNVMWLFCSLLGGIIFGIGPSTVAVYAIARKTKLGEEDFPLFRTFWNVYKAEFIKANALFLMLLAIGFVVYFNINYFRLFDDMFHMGMQVFSTIIALMFIFIALYIFPVYVHYDLEFKKYIQYASALSILHLGQTALMILSAVSVYYFFISFPGFIPLFAVSFIIHLNVWLAFRTIEKVESKGEQLKEVDYVKIGQQI